MFSGIPELMSSHAYDLIQQKQAVSKHIMFYITLYTL